MDDYISRQAAIDEANNWLVDCFKIHKQDRSCGLIRRLEDMPAADVVPAVHGRWVKEYWHGETTRRCSVCNITQTVTVYKDDIKFKYCPYCGAKMGGERKEQEHVDVDA